MRCIVNYILYFDVISCFCTDPYCVLFLLLEDAASRAKATDALYL